MEAVAIRVVLLDVEGTTTPVGFVYETLFPYARANLGPFLAERLGDRPVADAVQLLAGERSREAEAPGLPAWDDGSPDSRATSAAAYARWLMDRDRKSTGLKALQGMIWEQGYRAAELSGQVYPDVPPALELWRRRGLRVAIFSSGSILAQKLLFKSTPGGDLLPLIAAHFDTTTGSKLESESYARISAALGSAPPEVMFVSDVIAELDAARQAGMATRLCVRGPSGPEGSGHRVVRELASLLE